jgi:hypothetical protein
MSKNPRKSKIAAIRYVLNQLIRIPEYPGPEELKELMNPAPKEKSLRIITEWNAFKKENPDLTGKILAQVNPSGEEPNINRIIMEAWIMGFSHALRETGESRDYGRTPRPLEHKGD